MAFDDALFQLGMDLTRSSTTQTEDLIVRMPDVRDEVRKDPFIERDGVKFAGTHLIVDLVGARRLGDLKHVEDTLKRCVEVAGATLLHVHVHRHEPKAGQKAGLSGVAVFDQSHISFHSWPDAGYAAFDVFLRGDAEPEAVVDVLRQAFNAVEVIVNEHRRGEGAVRPKLRAVTAKKMTPDGERSVTRLSRVRKVA